jgi:predicted Zn-dependent peptidase
MALTGQIYATAYGAQSSLGHSYYTAGASRPSIISFHEITYTLNGAVLAATGIADHEAFVRMVEDEFPKFTPPKVEKVECLLGRRGEVGCSQHWIHSCCLGFQWSCFYSFE